MLDRLIDPASGGTVWRRGYGPEQMADAVRRDLEELLNTRQTSTDLSPDFVELHRSIFAYGLPDLTSLDAFTPQQREDIGHLIEEIITAFEPRLRNIRATLLTPSDSRNRSIRFRIDAQLAVEPAPDVVFETFLDEATGWYKVKHGDT